LLCGWLCFIFTLDKESIVNTITQEKENRPIFSKKIRRFAIVGIITFPLLIGGYFGWQYYKENFIPPGKIRILIANFDGLDPKKYRVTEIILEQLQKATKEYTDIEVISLGDSITAQQRSKGIDDIFKQYKPSILLWGWYGVTEERAIVSLHFEIKKELRPLQLLQEELSQKIAVAELNSFVFQERLSKEMAYLTLLTVGLACYKAQEYDDAILRFTRAISQTIVPVEMVAPAAIHLYRGNAYCFKSDYDSAMTDYNQAIKLNPTHPVAYNNRGNVHTIKNDLTQAIADYNQAIALDSTNEASVNSRCF